MTAELILFIYGTLKRGCRNHSVMRGAEFAGQAATEPAYLLVNCGAYPGLVRAAGERTGVSVRGELYRVDGALLAELDRFEGVPSDYVRAMVRLADGSEAQTYLYARSTAGMELCGAEWVE